MLNRSLGKIANEKTIRQYAACGVNYISSGALLILYNMDLSLKSILIKLKQ